MSNITFPENEYKNIHNTLKLSDKDSIKQINHHKIGYKNHIYLKSKTHKIFSKLSKKVRILIIDISQGCYNKSLITTRLNDFIIESQLDGLEKTHSSILINLLSLNKSSKIEYNIWYPDKDLEFMDLEKYDYWICTGGPASVLELDQNTNTKNTNWLKNTLFTLKLLQKLNKPGFAIGLGHQLFAKAKGGIVQNYSKYPEFGTVDLSLCFSKKLIQINATHSDSVVVKPKNSKVIGWNKYNQCQILEYRLKNNQKIITIQNHPEISSYYLDVFRFIRYKDITECQTQHQRKIIKNDKKSLKILEYITKKIIKTTKLSN